jgi:hypothetical protein
LFWLGAISIFGLALIPFGFRAPSLKLVGLSFTAGLLDLIASFFYYSALKSGEASDELAAMGGFGPVITAFLSIPLLKVPIGGDLTGSMLMSAGGFLMFFAEKLPLRKILPKILIAAAGFGLMNVLQKIVFNQTNFVSGYIFFTVGTPDRWHYSFRHPGVVRLSRFPDKRKPKTSSGICSTGLWRGWVRF